MISISRNLSEADRALFKLGKSIEILDRLKWKNSVRDRFLKDWKKKKKTLPQVEYPTVRFDHQVDSLKSIMKLCDKKHPLALIVYETAQSYLRALGMVQNAGKKRFTILSQELYGSPDDHIDKVDVSTVRAATFFLNAAKKFKHVLAATESDYCIVPEYVASRIRKTAKKVFRDKEILITTDPKLVAKASAGANRIRVRSATCFADHDIHQLINHELLVHTLTLQNGRKQRLRTLGLNSPRTTRTQEGLAVFAEFITSSIDMHRLRRLSARVRAVEMGLHGADFIEVFEFFLEQGQTEAESYHSAMRVFRGGKVEGGVVFTKDIVYLRGFIEVHRFFLKSLQDEQFLYPHYLFSGRLRTQDIEALEPYFLSDFLKGPYYEPDWIKNRSTLLAFLLSSSMMDKLRLTKVSS